MQDCELQPWLERMIQGDEDAFRYIYDLTKDDIYRLLVFLINDREDASDVMSEVYLSLHRSLSGYRPEQSFRKWLNGIAVRQASNWKRKLWRRMRLFERVSAAADSPQGRPLAEERALARESSLELLALVDRLPYKLKEVVVLRHYREYSLEEIAETLNIPIGTVKSRHHSAIGKLRQWIGQDMFLEEAAVHAD